MDAKKESFDKEDKIVDLSEIRQCLADKHQAKYPLNTRADAAECMDDLLTLIQDALMPPGMRLEYTGSLLHYAVGLDLVVHT